MSTSVKLFVLMVLQLFIWGAWLPVIFGYLPSLGFTKDQGAWILNAFTMASITAMLFSAPFADRRFAAEKFLAVSHVIGGAAMIALYWVRDFETFFALMLVHSLFYVPTLSIANSVAFAHVTNPQREFPRIRMGGTIGWILAAWPLFFILQGKEGPEAVPLKASVFLISGGVSILLALFCLTLPHTPPRQSPTARPALAEVLSLLRMPFVLVLFVVTFIDAAVHQGYFVLTDSFLRESVGVADSWVMPVMSLGQVAEIGTMAVLGYVLKSLGWRTTMTIGVLGHTARFAVFAYFPDQVGLVVAVNLLHGICYAFFFATVYIFVDEFFPKGVRSTAQGLFNFLILGAGPFAGNWACSKLAERLQTAQGKTDYAQVFPLLAGASLVGAALLALLFWPPKTKA